MTIIDYMQEKEGVEERPHPPFWQFFNLADFSGKRPNSMKDRLTCAGGI
jgi:hypothetical protein